MPEIVKVKINAPLDAPNTDAIDPTACTNVWIHDCDIDVGDDDIAIKGSGHVENVLIEDLRVKHGHGISIGSEFTGGAGEGVNRAADVYAGMFAVTGSSVPVDVSLPVAGSMPKMTTLFEPWL